MYYEHIEEYVKFYFHFEVVDHAPHEVDDMTSSYGRYWAINVDGVSHCSL